MNTIIRLITVSLMISVLALGMAGYAGSKSRSLPIGEALEEVQANCAVMLQDIKTLTSYMLPSALAGPCYSVSEFPVPVVYQELISYPF
jgi:hypothetical protein